MPRGKESHNFDNESRAILFEGANLSQLGEMFRMNHTVLIRKLQPCRPVGKRNGADIYAIHEVAPYLVKPAYDIETYIRRMAHTELPKMLTKEFWAAMRSRQMWEKENGDLWPTAQVIEKVGEIFKIVKNKARITQDAVERQVELTPKQRNIIKDQMDGMLEEVRVAIVINFTPKNPEVEEDGSASADEEEF